MKTAAIIQARMGSSRLPNKVLKPVLEKPLLGWMLDRVSLSVGVDEIVVATTVNAKDDVIDDYVRSCGYRVYRGSEDDVLDRYYHASTTVAADTVVRLTADCPLLDPLVLDCMVQEFHQREVDFLSNSEPLPSSWPDGMDVSVMSMSALQQAWLEAAKPSEREHVTFFFWSNTDRFKCHRIDHEPDLSKYRLTMDYPEDYDLVKSVIEHFGAVSPGRVLHLTMAEIVAFLDRRPDLIKLNQKYVRGQGWAVSFEQDKQAGF